jgi:hypothetical protein
MLQEVGDIRLRGSVGAGFTGMIPANVAQVPVSSNRLEDGSVFDFSPSTSCGGNVGNAKRFPSGRSPRSLPSFVVAANSAGVRSANDEWARLGCSPDAY